MKAKPKSPAISTLSHLLDTKRILVTCGLGGVGKTTISAAMGVRAALQGKRVLVITMDPARRLATSLGMQQNSEKMENTPFNLTGTLKKISQNSGELYAVMPKTQKSFESFVQSVSMTNEIADKIIGNRIFKIFAQEFSGANEYMAMERLLHYSKQEKYDLIILDTPPSRNTLEFLDAPETLKQFFEERFAKWLATSQNDWFAKGVRKVLSLLERLTGQGFITDLVQFAGTLLSTRARFVANLEEILSKLRSPSTGFLIVLSPETSQMDEVLHFAEQVQQHDFQLDGVLLNRSLHEIPQSSSSAFKEGSLPKKLFNALSKREEKTTIEIQEHLEKQNKFFVRVPELARDVHSIGDLVYVAQSL